MSHRYRNETRKPVRLEDYAVEWFVEDPARYERLSGRRISHDVGTETFNRATRKYEKEMVVDRVVVALVLEVPRLEFDQVGNALRSGPLLRCDASYLQVCARNADQALPELDEHVGLLEARMAKLEEVATRMARRLEELGDDPCPSPAVAPRNPSVTWTDLLAREANFAASESFKATREALDKMRSAVLERKSEVAATLLSKIDDEED